MELPQARGLSACKCVSRDLARSSSARKESSWACNHFALSDQVHAENLILANLHALGGNDDHQAQGATCELPSCHQWSYMLAGWLCTGLLRFSMHPVSPVSVLSMCSFLALSTHTDVHVCAHV
eukprot:1161447-Pelagomonas_calceolata.AAC.10